MLAKLYERFNKFKDKYTIAVHAALFAPIGLLGAGSMWLAGNEWYWMIANAMLVAGVGVSLQEWTDHRVFMALRQMDDMHGRYPGKEICNRLGWHGWDWLDWYGCVIGGALGGLTAVLFKIL